MTSSVFPSHYIYHPALHPHHPSLFDLTTSASDLSFIDGKPSSLLSSHPFHRYFVAGDGLKKVSDASKPSGKSFTIDSILARSDRLSHEKLMATHSESKELPRSLYPTNGTLVFPRGLYATAGGSIFSTPPHHPHLHPFDNAQHQSMGHHCLSLSSAGHGGGKRKRSWSRAVFSNLQRKGLEKRFTIQKYITKPDRRQLAATLGLTDAQVKVWFQNRRMKWRHSKEYREEMDKSGKSGDTDGEHGFES